MKLSISDGFDRIWLEKNKRMKALNTERKCKYWKGTKETEEGSEKKKRSKFRF